MIAFQFESISRRKGFVWLHGRSWSSVFSNLASQQPSVGRSLCWSYSNHRTRQKTIASDDELSCRWQRIVHCQGYERRRFHHLFRFIGRPRTQVSIRQFIPSEILIEFFRLKNQYSYTGRERENGSGKVSRLPCPTSRHGVDRRHFRPFYDQS